MAPLPAATDTREEWRRLYAWDLTLTHTYASQSVLTVAHPSASNQEVLRHDAH